MTTNRSAPHPRTHHLRVQRTARYFTLGAEGESARAIWFLLHGFGQLAGDFIKYFSDLADADTLLVAPEAMNRFYLQGIDKPASERPVGATWMTREDRASEIADYVEYLETLHDEILTPFGGLEPIVNVVGFSQGAATATRWITHGTRRVNRLILWGGLLPPEIDLKRGNASLRQIRLTIVAGSRDKYLSDEMIAAEQARLDAAGVTYDLMRFDGGHVVSRSVFPRLRAPSEASG